jgi:hypothetical protein
MKKSNDTLSSKLKELENKNSQMTLKIEQSFSSQQRSDMPSGAMSMGGHQMGGKQKYNSIDIAYDEANFGDNLHQKNVRSNTN